MNTNTIPQIKVGSQVRVKVEGSFNNCRGVVAEQAGKVWGVRLNGETAVTDFSEAELTVLE